MSGLLRVRWAPLLAATVLLGIVLGAVTRSFGTTYNVYAILQTAALDAVIGLSQMVVLAVGDLSLAVGGLAALSTVTVGYLFEVQHWPAALCVLAGLVLGAAGGLANGMIISRTRLSGFIVTLATGSAFTGIAYGVTSSVAYSDVPSSILKLSQGRVGFFPYALFVALAATVIMYGGLRWLPDGRLILAVGGNRDAAVLSGLSSRRAQVIAHAVSGLLAGVAAVMYLGIIGTATPAAGSDWLIISFAVPIIGGTALTGGEASAFGGLVAAVVLSAISDALIVLNVSTNAIEMAEGLLILAAVLASRLGERAQREAARRRAPGRAGGQPETAGAATPASLTERVAEVNRDRDGTAMGDAEASDVFEVSGISKAFGGIAALDEAGLQLSGGEIHALVGENGAGKSTLINISTGVYAPDGGQIVLDGAPVELGGPRSAAEHGIGVVHQERNLVGAFSVAENLFLRNQSRSRGLVSYRRMFSDARLWLQEVGLNVDPSTEARLLSPGQAQLLEVAKALSAQCRVLFLDEPTSSISETDSEHLFAILRELRDKGTAIAFVSHKLEEVYGLCDRVTVLRDGRNVVTGRPLADISREDIVRAMVGREALAAPGVASRRRGTGAARLKLEAVATAYGHEDVNLTVHSGEIVGLYGLVGAGRTELARCLVGLGRITGGTFSIDGKPAHIRNPYAALRNYSMGYVSEDRKGEGLILSHSISRNVGITIWDRVSGLLGRISERAVRPLVMHQAKRLQLKMNSLSQTVSLLSGGNQQKVSLAKWLAAETEILLLDEPTVGVDVGAKGEVHGLVRGLADQGKAILLISSDLREIVQLADRIVVMGNFRILGEIHNTGDYTSASKAIMERITGASSFNQIG
jgi:ribose transport system ATP-binding protein